MNPFSRWLDEPDLSTFLLMALGSLVGSAMVGHDQYLRRWGWRVAVGLLVSYVIYAVCLLETYSAEEYLWVGIRGVFVAGLAVGPAWMALAIGNFVHEYVVRCRMWISDQRLRRLRSADERLARERLNHERAARLAAEEAHRQWLANQPPPPTRSERVRQAVGIAKGDFETESATLQSAGLDEDELEAALLHARTRYLRKLKESLQ